MGTLTKLAISKVHKIELCSFLCTKLFQKRGHYSRGEIIQGGTLFKGGHYSSGDIIYGNMVFNMKIGLYLKEKRECLSKGLEIVYVIKSWPNLDILEE